MLSNLCLSVDFSRRNPLALPFTLFNRKSPRDAVTVIVGIALQPTPNSVTTRRVTLFCTSSRRQFGILANPNVHRPLDRITALRACQLQAHSTIPWLTPHLLDKARHTLATELLNHVPRPVKLERACSVAAFAADDEPVDAGQVDVSEVFEQRLRSSDSRRSRPTRYVGVRQRT